MFRTLSKTLATLGPIVGLTMLFVTPASAAILALQCSTGPNDVNVPFSSSITATGETPSYLYSIEAPLPRGLNQNTSTSPVSVTCAGVNTGDLALDDSMRRRLPLPGH